MKYFNLLLESGIIIFLSVLVINTTGTAQLTCLLTLGFIGFMGWLFAELQRGMCQDLAESMEAAGPMLDQAIKVLSALPARDEKGRFKKRGAA